MAQGDHAIIDLGHPVNEFLRYVGEPFGERELKLVRVTEDAIDFIERLPVCEPACHGEIQRILRELKLHRIR